MKINEDQQSTITERGQVSIPARLRKKMQLRPGQVLSWTMIGPAQFSVTVLDAEASPGPTAALGYLKQRFGAPQLRTNDLMKELRDGDRDEDADE